MQILPALDPFGGGPQTRDRNLDALPTGSVLHRIGGPPDQCGVAIPLNWPVSLCGFTPNGFIRHTSMRQIRHLGRRQGTSKRNGPRYSTTVIDDLHLVRIAVAPHEAQPELVIDPDACWPARLPDSASRRLAGGVRNSSKRVAAASMRSLRREAFARSAGKPFGILSSHTAAVRLSANDLIIRDTYHVSAVRQEWWYAVGAIPCFASHPALG